MAILHFPNSRRSCIGADDDSPMTVTPFGFAVGRDCIAWQSVAEIRAYKVDRRTTDEAFVEFWLGGKCIAISEGRVGFDELEAAMVAAFPDTACWRGHVQFPVRARNETVLFRRN